MHQPYLPNDINELNVWGNFVPKYLCYHVGMWEFILVMIFLEGWKVVKKVIILEITYGEDWKTFI